jgi:hypothetical protein
MFFSTRQFDRTDPATGKCDPVGTLWVAEHAELGRPQLTKTFLFQNCPVDGQHRSFRFVKTDESSGGIMGWRYEEEAGPNRGPVPLTVLIIND